MSVSLGPAALATIAGFRQLSEEESASANKKRAAGVAHKPCPPPAEGRAVRWQWRTRVRQMPNPRRPQPLSP